LNPIHAMLLGLIEGISEYLPVSANAHVIILGNLLGEPADLVKTFGVALQAAPMLAVLILYWRRFEALVLPSSAGKSEFKGQNAWILMSLGVLPVLVTGFLFKKYFYGLMLDPLPSVIGLALGGVAILLVEYWHKEKGANTLDQISPAQAFGIGLIQCLALWPGISRSGATIVAGLLLGLNRKASAEFSFLIGVPVFAAAAALEFHKSDLLRANLGSFGIAFVVSFICALLSVKLFINLLGKISFKPFGWYRIALSPILWIFFHA
jgi:undecaprenyl-diphosphatase